MINPLIISRNENIGIFRAVCAQIDAEPRELIGDDWSLALFLKRDLKNYAYQSHFILDVSAFREKDDMFVSLVESLTYQSENAKIIIFAGELYGGDELLDKLVHIGITDIAANYSDKSEKDNLTAIKDDLKDCLTKGLSRNKWRRFDKSLENSIAAQAAKIAEEEKAKPRYENAHLHIAVVGAQSRIGATTFALRLASYFNARDAQSVVVCAAKRGIPQLEMISEMYGGQLQDGIYTISGLDICGANVEPKKEYNAEIYDFSSARTSDIDFNGFDKVYIIGGTSWNELPMTYDAQLSMNKIRYTVGVNLSDPRETEKFKDALSVNLNDIIQLPFEPNPFSLNNYEEIFDNEFNEWSDEIEEEITEEK